jgi:hypothetical protein
MNLKKSVVRYSWSLVKAGIIATWMCWKIIFILRLQKAPQKVLIQTVSTAHLKKICLKHINYSLKWENNTCDVKYKVLKCIACNMWHILSSGNHEHTLFATYNNLRMVSILSEN